MVLGFLPSHLVHCLVGHLHHVETVEGQVGIGKGSLDPLDEGLVHVHAGFLDVLGLASVSQEVGFERCYRGRVPAFGGKQEGAGCHVHEQRDVVLASSRGGLVHSELSDAGHVLLASGLVYMMVEDPPDPRVMLPDQAGSRSHRHALHQGHDQGLEQQGEA